MLKKIMRVTKTKLTKKEARRITNLVDKLVAVDDFTLATDFAKDAYVLFNEELSKRKTFKSFWQLFKDIKALYSKFKMGDLMKNVDFYNQTKTFLRYFITSSFFRELDKLDAIEALEKFLIMFKPPQKEPPKQPQSQPQDEIHEEDSPDNQKKGKKQGGQDKKGNGKSKNKKRQGPPKIKPKGGGKSKQSPSGKSKDKKGLSADKANLPIDMTKFKKRLPKIEKAINSGLFNKEDFQKYLGKNAGINHKEVDIGNIVNLIDKIAENLSDKELDIFYVARKKELTEKYRREQIMKSVPYPDNEMSIKNIKKYEELLKTIPSQYALDDDIFNQKLLKKELLVRDYQSRRLKKQALYLLIDVSGSMDEGGKNVYASGVALAFVRQAISEGSTYFLRFFDHNPHSLYKITNKEDAEKMCDILVKKPYSGGGTNIGNAIETAVNDIKDDPVAFEKAEIMIITDGEDSGFNINKDQLEKIKLHSTVIGGSNPALEELSDSYVELDSKDIVV